MSCLDDDAIFGEAVKVVARRHWDVWTKLLAGAEARAEVAERRADMAEEKVRLTNLWVDKLEAQLAKVKQQRTTSS